MIATWWLLKKINYFLKATGLLRNSSTEGALVKRSISGGSDGILWKSQLKLYREMYTKMSFILYLTFVFVKEYLDVNREPTH